MWFGTGGKGRDMDGTAAGDPPCAMVALGAALEPPGTLDDAAERLGPSGHGLMLAALALPNCVPGPPGLSLAFGLPAMLVAGGLALGHRRVRLPGFLARRPLDAGTAAAVSRAARRILGPVAGRCRPRLAALVEGRGARLAGLAAVVLAFVMALPIPLGTLPPAVALAVLGLGLATRDGAVALLGMGMGALAVAVALAVNAGIVLLLLGAAGA